MKILLCVNSDIGRGNTIGFRFGKIVEELNRQGIAYDILARANYDSKLSVTTPWYKNILARTLKSIRLFFFPWWTFRSLDVWLFDRFVLSHLKRTQIHYPVAHVGEYIPKTIDYLKNQDTKVILEIPIAHHNYAVYLKNIGIKSGVRIGNLPSYLKHALDQADACIVPSSFVVDSLTQAGVKKNIYIIPFGVTMPADWSEENIIHRAQQKKIIYLFAGNVNYRKGIVYLLEAWQKANLQNAQLIIAGRVFREVRSLVNQYLDSSIRYVGFVNLKEYFKQAQVLVFPTLLEGSAKAVYEAMSYGLTIVTTPNAGSIVEDGKSGFIVSIANAKQLAEKLQFLHTHHEVIADMGKAAFQRVQGYSWERYVASVVDVYHSFV